VTKEGQLNSQEFERLAKRFVDAVQEFDQIAAKVDRMGEKAASFFNVVAKEMRRRGMSEERIQSMLKGAELGRQIARKP
jgi:hypothetical protein